MPSEAETPLSLSRDEWLELVGGASLAIGALGFGFAAGASMVGMRVQAEVGPFTGYDALKVAEGWAEAAVAVAVVGFGLVFLTAYLSED